jgi:hypothetical protein
MTMITKDDVVANVEAKISIGSKILGFVLKIFGIKVVKGPKVDKLP